MTSHLPLALPLLARDLVDHDLVARARTLRPLLEANAVRCETDRRLPDETVAALDDAGLFGTLAPKRCGGLGTTMATQLAVAAELGAGCASTAWVQTLIAVTTWAASLQAPAGQAEVFAGAAEGGRLPRVCGVLAPSGTATPVDGGFLVTGRWGFASGSLHADWATCGVVVVDCDGREVARDTAFMPLADLSIDDTWFVAGMRGTGSNTLVATEVFVPTHRLAFAGLAAAGPADPTLRTPSDQWPIGGTLAVVLLGPMLGVASAALAAVTAKAPTRAVSYTSFGRQIDSPVLLTDLARAGLDVDTAHLHAFTAAATIDAAGAGAPLDAATIGRVRGACGYAADTLRRAMSTLVDVGGASSFAEASALQRHWRDLNVGTRHAFLATAPVLETYGRSLFELEPIMDLV